MARNSPEPELATEAMQVLKQGFDRLLDELRTPIVNSEYGILIGDDTTGRIPARLVHQVIREWNRDHGLPPVGLVFIQGTREEGQLPLLQDAIRKRERFLDARIPGKKALIVTEGVTSGGSIARLGRELTARGIRFDVAILDGAYFTRGGTGSTASTNGVKIDDAGWPVDTRMFRGRENAWPLRDRPDYTGLRTEKFSPDPRHRFQPGEKNLTREIRQDMHSLARHAADRFDLG